jgi:hypothetical protein
MTRQAALFHNGSRTSDIVKGSEHLLTEKCILTEHEAELTMNPK